MKKRSNFAVMKNLIHLVKPLTDYMILAILMGLLGHLCASFITIFGAFGILQVLGMWKGSLGFLFIGVAVFAVLRGILRYAEQSCNHFIAFKLLALIRDEVFQSLRKLTPAKLEGKDKGNLITVITSDIELLDGDRSTLYDSFVSVYRTVSCDTWNSRTACLSGGRSFDTARCFQGRRG